MLGFDEVTMLEEKQTLTKELIEHISDIESSFVLIYRENKQDIIGYVKTKDIILKYLKSRDRTKGANIVSLVKNKVFKTAKVYHDAIAVEALEVFEVFKTQVILVANQHKHRKEI